MWRRNDFSIGTIKDLLEHRTCFLYSLTVLLVLPHVWFISKLEVPLQKQQIIDPHPDGKFFVDLAGLGIGLEVMN